MKDNCKLQFRHCVFRESTKLRKKELKHSKTHERKGNNFRVNVSGSTGKAINSRRAITGSIVYRNLKTNVNWK